MRARNESIKALCVIIVLSAVSLAGLYVFSTGFLTARVELPHRSSPDDGHEISSTIKTAAAFDRAVLLIVDALRVDFLFPDHQDGADKGMHQGQMPRTAALLSEAGKAASAMKFTADVPTITMSRLKALITGGMPTFLDIGNSFSATAISEDSLLGQLTSMGKRAVVMGDDTWMQMAPWAFKAGAHPFPSFNVMDLDTVDNGVWQHLPSYLGQSPTQWALLIAHFLGVDHAGHSYGANSQEMVKKLNQIDGWLEQAAGLMLEGAGPGGPHERTLLVILGDHAQTLTGDHGGGSPDETDTLILTFNMGKWWQQRRDREILAGRKERPLRDGGAAEGMVDVVMGGEGTGGDQAGDVQIESGVSAAEARTGSSASCLCDDASAPDRLKRLVAGLEGTIKSGCEASLCYSGLMPQVDFAASLSVSLGLPIPFGSVGRLDPTWWRMATPQIGGEVKEFDGSNEAPASLRKVDEVDGWKKSCRKDSKGTYGTDADNEFSRANEGSEQSCQALGTMDPSKSSMGWLFEYEQALRMNAWQVHRYLNTYAAHASLSKSDMEVSNRLYESAVRYSAQSGSQSATQESLLGSCLDLLAYLEHAVGVARDKFCRFDLVRMAFGCVLMVASVCLHLFVISRLYKHDLRTLVLSPECLAVGFGSVLHALSLFGVTWIMGEGRLQSTLVAVVLAVTWASAAWTLSRAQSAVTKPSHDRKKSGTSSRNEIGIIEPQLKKGHADDFPRVKVTSDGRGGKCNDAWNSGSLLHGGWLDWAQLVLLGLTAAICWATLQRVGLIDRYGADPHDKAQPEALIDLLGEGDGRGEERTSKAGSDAGQDGGGTGAAAAEETYLPRILLESLMALKSFHPSVILPLLATPMVLAVCHSYLVGLVKASVMLQDEKGSTRDASKRRGHWPWLAAICAVQHVCSILWWLLQAVKWEGYSPSKSFQSALNLWSSMCSGCTEGPEGPSAGKGWADNAYYSSWLDRMGRGALCDVWRPLSALEVPFAKDHHVIGPGDPNGHEPTPTVMALLLKGFVNFLPDMEFRLLLPRIVYGAALMVVLLEVVLGPIRLALGCSSSMKKAISGKGHHTGSVERFPSDSGCGADCHLASEMGHHIWLMGCMMAPVAVLLGQRGPLVILCGLVMVASMTAVLIVRQRLRIHRLLAMEEEEGFNTMKDRRRMESHSTGGRARSSGTSGARDVAFEQDMLGVAGPAMWAMSGAMLFFCSGHFCEFSGLQYTSPFIGFDDMEWYVSGAMLISNTFGAMALPALALPILAKAQRCLSATYRGSMGRRLQGDISERAKSTGDGEIGDTLALSAAVFLAVRTLNTCTTAVCAAVLRKNIVVWAIIAPKLVFELFFFTVTSLSLFTGILMAA